MTKMWQAVAVLLVLVLGCERLIEPPQAPAQEAQPQAWYLEPGVREELEAARRSEPARAPAPTSVPDAPVGAPPPADESATVRPGRISFGPSAGDRFDDEFIGPLPPGVEEEALACIGACDCIDGSLRLIHETQCQRRRTAVLNAPRRRPDMMVPECPNTPPTNRICYYAGRCTQAVCANEPPARL